MRGCCRNISMVPEPRLELGRPCGPRSLSPLRLPFRHSGGLKITGSGARWRPAGPTGTVQVFVDFGHSVSRERQVSGARTAASPRVPSRNVIITNERGHVPRVQAMVVRGFDHEASSAPAFLVGTPGAKREEGSRPGYFRPCGRRHAGAPDGFGSLRPASVHRRRGPAASGSMHAGRSGGDDRIRTGE